MDGQAQRTPRKMRRLIGWIVVASIVVIGLLGSTGASALAVVGTSLHQTPPISSTDPNFQGSDEDCADAGLAPGQVLWHFVLVQTNSSSGTLTATFTNAGTVVTGSYKYSGHTLQFNIITGADTLLGASTDAVGALLNLSHICSGGTLTTTTSSSTTTTTTTSISTSTSSSSS